MLISPSLICLAVPDLLRDSSSNPWDVAIDSQGMVYVADNANHRVQKFTPEGEFVMVIGRLGSQPGELNLSHHLLPLTTWTMCMWVSQGTSVCQCSPATENSFTVLDKVKLSPYGLAIDEGGHLYVCDY